MQPARQVLARDLAGGPPERGGVAVANWGFASLPVGGSTGLYRIELTTGRAIPIGTLGDAIVDGVVRLFARVADLSDATRGLVRRDDESPAYFLSGR